MIENRHLIDALVAKARETKASICAPAPVASFEARRNAIAVTFKGGETVSARLLVGADGARSAVREAAGIATHGWDYDQSAIVTTVGA